MKTSQIWYAQLLQWKPTRCLSQTAFAHITEETDRKTGSLIMSRHYVSCQSRNSMGLRVSVCLFAFTRLRDSRLQCASPQHVELSSGESPLGLCVHDRLNTCSGRSSNSEELSNALHMSLRVATCVVVMRRNCRRQTNTKCFAEWEVSQMRQICMISHNWDGRRISYYYYLWFTATAKKYDCNLTLTA